MKNFSKERYSTSGGNLSISFDFDGSYIDFEDDSLLDQVRRHYSDPAWAELQNGGWEDWDRLWHILHIEAGLALAEANAIVAKAQHQRAQWWDEIDLYYSGAMGKLRRAWEVARVGGVLIAFLIVIFWIAKNVT